MTYEELKQYEAVRAVSLAFSALMRSKVVDREDKKAIKQPLKELKNPNPIELKNDYAKCPNCGEWLSKKKLGKHRYNYCPKCGQALDCGEVKHE